MGLISRPAKINSPGNETTYQGLVTEGVDKRIMAADVDAEMALIFGVLGLSGGIEAINMDADSVGTTAIQNGAVTASKLATDAVETAKIKDLNVTTGKLAVGAAAANLGALSVAQSKLAVNAAVNNGVVEVVNTSLGFHTTETEIVLLPPLLTRGGRVLLNCTGVLSVLIGGAISGTITFRWRWKGGVTPPSGPTDGTTAIRWDIPVANGAGNNDITVPVPLPGLIQAAGGFVADTYHWQLTALTSSANIFCTTHATQAGQAQALELS